MSEFRMKVVIDCDDVLVNSNLRIRQMYQEQFGGDLPSELLVWNGADQLTKVPDERWIERQFDCKEFFHGLEILPNVKEILQQLKDSDKFDMYCCSIGLKTNIQSKMDFMESSGLSSYFKDLIFCVKTGNSVSMGKDFLTYNSCMIDDNKNNLTHCKYPILFWTGAFKQWNDGFEGLGLNGWSQDAVTMLDQIYNKERYNVFYNKHNNPVHGW